MHYIRRSMNTREGHGVPVKSLAEVFGVTEEAANEAFLLSGSERAAEWVLLRAHVERLGVGEAFRGLPTWRSMIAGHYWAYAWERVRHVPPRFRLRAAAVLVRGLRTLNERPRRTP